MSTQQNDFKQEAYKTAINGFQFQISRYNTWMNYYAIFVGALFVAFYKVFPAGKEADCFLPVAIAFLGLVHFAVLVCFAARQQCMGQ